MKLRNWVLFVTMAAMSLLGSNLAWSSVDLTTLEWEKFYEEEGIELYRANQQVDGLIPFKAVAISDGSLEDYLKHLLDTKGRVNWAPKLDKISIHKKLSANEFIYSEFYRTPWPAMDRQFLLRGKVSFLDKNRIRLSAFNAGESEEFVSDDHIVCDVLLLNFELEKLGPSQTRLSFSFFGDMKGWMPVWLINLIQKKWPLRFIQKIREQVKLNDAKDLSIYSNLERRAISLP